MSESTRRLVAFQFFYALKSFVFCFLSLTWRQCLHLQEGRSVLRYTPPSATCDRRLDCVLCVRLQCACEWKTRGKMLRANRKPVCVLAVRGWSFLRNHEYFVRREIFDEWRSIRAMKNLCTHSFTSSSFRSHSYESFNQLLFTNNLLNAPECRSSSSSHMRMTIFLTHLYCRLFEASPLHF